MPSLVKNFSSLNSAAPVLNGVAQSVQQLLRAILVTGYGSKSVQSLSVTAGVATAAYATAHPYSAGMVLRTANAGVAAVNGESRILTATVSAVTFAVPGVPDGVVPGVITTDVAPAGWQEVYTSGTVSVFKPGAVEATGCYLRVDDGATTVSRVVGYESMSDAVTGTGPFPSAAQVAGGNYWPKSNVADASARGWRLFADSRSFLLYVMPSNGAQTHGVLLGFGDLVSNRSADHYGCMINGCDNNAASSATAQMGCLGRVVAPGSATDGVYLARAASGIGSSRVARKTSAYSTGAAYSGTGGYSAHGLPYPNGADNSLRLSPVDLLVSGEGVRGVIAGLYHSAQSMGDSFSTGDIVPGTGLYANKKFIALRVGAPGAALDLAGSAFVDISDSWRG